MISPTSKNVEKMLQARTNDLYTSLPHQHLKSKQIILYMCRGTIYFHSLRSKLIFLQLYVGKELKVFYFEKLPLDTLMLLFILNFY